MKRKNTPLLRPFVIGLTGSIGMGKSTVAAFFKKEGLPILEADKIVHALLKKGGAAVPAVASLFPVALKHGAIDRRLLSQEILAKPVKLKALEKILHPLVAEAEEDFITRQGRRGSKAVLLEIPLLFETHSEKRCDIVLCVAANKKQQTERVMARPGMTRKKMKTFLSRQMPDKEKRRRADLLIRTDQTMAFTRKQVRLFMRLLRQENFFA